MIPLTSIASFWSQFQIGLAAGERVFGLIDAEPHVVQIGAEKLPEVRGEICFDHVEFSYISDEMVLQDFSLTINAGETLALVGHTGSGKSSIGKLIARFYEFQGGRLSIDGCDIRELDLDNYHGHLGIVTQTPFLFDGTVIDNIRYGKRERQRRRGVRGGAGKSAAGIGSTAWRTAWKRRWGSAAATCRWASANWWPWRAWSCKTPRFSSWTRPPPASIR